MRFSVRDNDPGYLPYHLQVVGANKHLTVYLDGEVQSLVITADDETGEVVRYVRDAQGNPQIDPNNKDQAWTETVTGRVVLEIF